MTNCKVKFLFLLCFVTLNFLGVKTEEFGDGDSAFGEAELLKEFCEGDKCNVKVAGSVENDVSSEENSGSEKEIHVMITFTNAAGQTKFQMKFQQTVTSLLKHASVPIALYILGDPESQTIAKDIIKKYAEPKSSYRVVGMEIESIAKKTDEIIRPMQHHFSYKPGAYYSDALFFISIGMHKVMPDNLHKVIMLDSDLKFTDDIAKLHDRFRLFRKDNIMGIGYDLQPVYRHQFWKYRGENPGTRVGEPGPDGLQGFNSGVLLLDLDKMRKSDLYNSLINAKAVKDLTEEFSFKGHLGDQDFFTLVGMKYEWLFHVLPCQWNRQLCRWWEDKGYQDIFHKYFDCKDPIKIWHGNCGTPIPDE